MSRVPFELRPVGGALGAEVSGVDLRELDSSTFDAVHAALLEHQVLFFRGDAISDDQHLALAERWGRVSIFPLMKVMGSTEPSFQVIQDGPDSPPSADQWHTDVTWTPEPPKVAVLRATRVPARGGDTMWGSMTAAYESLSAPMQEFLAGLRVHHHNRDFVESVALKLGEEQVAALGIREKLNAEYPGVDHPLVRTHPETGRRAIFFGGGFMQHIVGFSRIESDAVLRFVRDHVENPNFHCRWNWRPGDVAIWDERATIHRALGDHFPLEREVRRCVVDGDRPFFDPSIAA